MIVGQTLGAYRVLDKLGEGGPPALAAAFGRQLRRGPAVAMERTWR